MTLMNELAAFQNAGTYTADLGIQAFDSIYGLEYGLSYEELTNFTTYAMMGTDLTVGEAMVSALCEGKSAYNNLVSMEGSYGDLCINPSLASKKRSFHYPVVDNDDRPASHLSHGTHHKHRYGQVVNNGERNEKRVFDADTTSIIQGGFNPNVLPLGDVCTSITPLMATFLQCEPWNEMAYEVLANDPRIDFIIRTPYLLVNILHVATAYSLQALQRVEQSIPLEAAGATAAGHTLLHIACMSSMIQHHASKTRESIHNLRCKAKGSSSIQQCELEFPAQMEMLGYLLSSGFEPYIGFQDSDLNTPLHYLAGARVINENAITLLRGLSDGERVWREVKNWYGYTAEEIWEQNRRIRTQKDDWYGGTTRKVAKIPPGYEL
ncbi:hypothetical protein N7490_006214 [Penicillium lividum]|nr:hypothetical protein N7490_006214 [Penicillium lividum]